MLLLVCVSAAAQKPSSRATDADYQLKCVDSRDWVIFKTLYGLSLASKADIVVLPFSLFPAFAHDDTGRAAAEAELQTTRRSLPKDLPATCDAPHDDPTSAAIILKLLTYDNDDECSYTLERASVTGQDLSTLLSNATTQRLGKADPQLVTYGIMELCGNVGGDKGTHSIVFASPGNCSTPQLGAKPPLTLLFNVPKHPNTW